MPPMRDLSDAYTEGYLAAENGKPRECVTPWSAEWQREWFRGYDEYFSFDR